MDWISLLDSVIITEEFIWVILLDCKEFICKSIKISAVNETDYIVYRSYDDYLNMKHPCHMTKKEELPQDPFTEVDFSITSRFFTF